MQSQDTGGRGAGRLEDRAAVEPPGGYEPQPSPVGYDELCGLTHQVNLEVFTADTGVCWQDLLGLFQPQGTGNFQARVDSGVLLALDWWDASPLLLGPFSFKLPGAWSTEFGQTQGSPEK